MAVSRILLPPRSRVVFQGNLTKRKYLLDVNLLGDFCLFVKLYINLPRIGKFGLTIHELALGSGSGQILMNENQIRSFCLRRNAPL